MFNIFKYLKNLFRPSKHEEITKKLFEHLNQRVTSLEKRIDLMEKSIKSVSDELHSHKDWNTCVTEHNLKEVTKELKYTTENLNEIVSAVHSIHDSKFLHNYTNVKPNPD